VYTVEVDHVGRALPNVSLKVNRRRRYAEPNHQRGEGRRDSRIFLPWGRPHAGRRLCLPKLEQDIQAVVSGGSLQQDVQAQVKVALDCGLVKAGVSPGA
jgi:hypothetical protein